MGFIQFINVASSQRRFGFRYGCLNIAGGGADFLAILVERLLHLIDKTIKLIARFDFLALLDVVCSMRLCIAHHLVDLVF